MLLHKLQKKFVQYIPGINPYVTTTVLDNFLTDKECDAIVALGKKNSAGKSAMIGGGITPLVEKTIRNTHLRKLTRNKESEWVYEKLDATAHVCNKKFYHFRLIGIARDLDLNEYSVGGHYIWHHDLGRGSHSKRKLSMTVQLTDPDIYEGGDLEFFLPSIKKAPRTKGSLTIFPSFQVHRVTPVTKGVRYALVGWVYGPPFK